MEIFARVPGGRLVGPEFNDRGSPEELVTVERVANVHHEVNHVSLTHLNLLDRDVLLPVMHRGRRNPPDPGTADEPANSIPLSRFVN